MADNFLERQYDDYLRRKAKAEAEKRARWKRQLDAYKKRIAEEKADADDK